MLTQKLFIFILVIFSILQIGKGLSVVATEAAKAAATAGKEAAKAAVFLLFKVFDVCNNLLGNFQVKIIFGMSNKFF